MYRHAHAFGLFDVRMVVDLPRHSIEVVSASAERARGNRVDRYVDGEEIVEIVFPAARKKELDKRRVLPYFALDLDP